MIIIRPPTYEITVDYKTYDTHNKVRQLNTPYLTGPKSKPLFIVATYNNSIYC